MRLRENQVIDRLKSGEKLIDNGTTAKFQDGGLCNIFTFWRLRDERLITATGSYPNLYWRWVFE